MAFRQIIPGVHQLSLRMVNCFLLQTEDGNVLVDTGMPEDAVRVLEAIRTTGLEDPRHILLSHCHPDHAGGASYLKAQTGAQVWAHHQDARLIEEGVGIRTVSAAPGAFNQLIANWLLRTIQGTIPACSVDHRVENGHVLPGNLIAVHTPGHTAGHLSFFWPQHRLLVAGDVASHLGWLRPLPIYEDYKLGLHTLRRLANLKFEVALFGHGTPIRKEAASRFRTRFGVEPTHESLREKSA
jgi:glyoxylase-like metal-dependent hydrolase (beta-lactamase superfamily II)